MPAASAPTIPDVLDQFARLMRDLHFTKLRYAGPWAAQVTLTLPQLRVLGLLARQTEGLSGRELAALLRVGPSAVTPLMDRLVEQGYARREEDLADRRITRLFATEHGLALLEQLVAGQREHMADVLAQLSPAELEAVSRGLELLNAGVQRSCRGPGEPASGPQPAG